MYQGWRTALLTAQHSKVVRESKSTEPLTPKGSPGFGNPEYFINVIFISLNSKP